MAVRPATAPYQADIAAGADEAIRAELVRRSPFIFAQKVCPGGFSGPPA
jgi:hypothetical protein